MQLIAINCLTALWNIDIKKLIKMTKTYNKITKTLTKIKVKTKSKNKNLIQIHNKNCI